MVIAIAAVLLPAIWALKAQPRLMRIFVPVCSAVVMLTGAYRLVERALAFW